MSVKQTINQIAAYGIMLIALALFLYYAFAGLGNFGQVNDFPEYGTAARLMVQWQAHKIYDLPQFFAAELAQFPMLGTRGVGLFIPPFAAPLLLPVALIPDAVAPVVWTVILILGVDAGIWMLKRIYEISRSGMPWLIGLTCMVGPTIESVRIGQLAPLLFLALSLANWYSLNGRPISCALALSVLVLKPQQMWPILIFALGAREFKVLRTIIAVMAVLGLASFVMFGMSGYMQYLGLVKDPANLDFMQPALNPTIRGQLMRLLGVDSFIPNVAGLAGLAIASTVAFVLGDRVRGQKRWLDLGLVGALPLGLVASMHCHDYDLLLLAPGIVALLSGKGLGTSTPITNILAGLVVISFLMPVYAEVHYSYLLRGGVVNPYFLLLLVFSISSFFSVWKAAGANASGKSG